ncbi:MAG: ATPase, AAA-type, CDC48 [Candidatus Syntrophoarchaeum caldarius]|uniref:ATPase, AAA-type, CDC48 n=1 Tax=Candidatus Syntropharchaeum caldarium TaxID=1838285 RepID=A0A1F2PB90_9EURY|nr:MAG: ATPase, AAA-type, CDC48 [Candidatus Syntrophoarchaeum caldarius]
MEDAEVTLKVLEAYHRDAGRGIARIDIRVMQKLNLVSGDVIEIIGKSRTPAVVWPGYSDDTGKAVIRIDGNIRGNLGVGIDDKVVVRKVDAKEAIRVAISPTEHLRIVGGDRYLLKILEGRALTKGQNIRLEMLGNPLTFLVTSTTPKDIVVVTKNTEIVLRERTFDPEQYGSRMTYEDVGGLKREIGLIREMIELPLRHPGLFQKLGIEPPRGVLLHGPPGTGKTLIAKAVASETDANFISISGPEIMNKFYGESEKHLRDIFDDAEKNAPSIIFIDEVDSIAPKRGEVTGEVERRVVAQLLALMDGLKSRGEVVVVAATNRPDALDAAIRRGGRFDREIEIGIPDQLGRLQILQIHTRGMPLDKDVDFEPIAAMTHGFVGADIATLCKEAAMHALRRILPNLDLDEDIPQEILDELTVTQSDFLNALKNVEPSAMREVSLEIPKVRWDDVGGLSEVKEALKEAVEWPLKYPELFKQVGAKPPKGILLYGPPGTGKTLLAKAVANESGANFISIKGPEFFSKWVGESEKAVREIFRKAKQAAPSIIFFDEIDSIATSRGATLDSSATERVISQILSEIDGIEDLKDVIVIAATNRPDLLDPALFRPGRIEQRIEVGAPETKEARLEIIKVHLHGKQIADDVDLDWFAKITEGFVGADIEFICRQALMNAIREYIRAHPDEDIPAEEAKSIIIRKEHIDNALAKAKEFEDSKGKVGLAMYA